MKPKYTLIALLILPLALQPGCSPQSRKEKGKSVRDAVDTVLIQRPKIEAGVRAGRKIRRISTEHQKDLDAAMGD